MILAEELVEGGDEVRFDEAREGFGEEVGELGWVASMGPFQGLDGLDCFCAQDSTFD